MKHLVGLLFGFSVLFAQTEQLIIDANDSRGNDLKGIITFTGNVKIKMGKDKLNANKVDVFFSTDKNSNTKTPLKYVANGNVDFEIVTDAKHYVGKGDKVVYSPQKEEYTINGNGFLQEKNDDRKVYGEKIYVNQLTGEARVSGSEKKPVRFIINVERGQKK